MFSYSSRFYCFITYRCTKNVTWFILLIRRGSFDVSSETSMCSEGWYRVPYWWKWKYWTNKLQQTENLPEGYHQSAWRGRWQDSCWCRAVQQLPVYWVPAQYAHKRCWPEFGSRQHQLHERWHQHWKRHRLHVAADVLPDKRCASQRSKDSGGHHWRKIVQLRRHRYRRRPGPSEPHLLDCCWRRKRCRHQWTPQHRRWSRQLQHVYCEQLWSAQHPYCPDHSESLLRLDPSIHTSFDNLWKS